MADLSLEGRIALVTGGESGTGAACVAALAEAGADVGVISTGPLLRTVPERPVMFCNGADRDADWGIGDEMLFRATLKQV